MRCRQLLSLSVTLATVLVLVKCETAGNTSTAQEKASGDQQENKTAIDNQQETKDTIEHQVTNVNASATVNETETATDSTTETVKPTTNSTAHQTTQTSKEDGNTPAQKKDETTTAAEGNAVTDKPTMKVPTTTPKPQNSTSSALTALSAVTLCVLSLAVSL